MKYISVFFYLTIVQFISFSQPSGNCIVLDGTVDFYEVADNSTLDPTTVVSFEAWINPCDTIGNHVVFTKAWCNGNRFAYTFTIIDGFISWKWDNDGSCGNGIGEYRSSFPIVKLNQWQHIAVVYTGSIASLYYNGNIISGSLVSGNYTSIYNSDQPLRVGTYKFVSGADNYFFNGRIDELRKWNYALTQAEISSRMNSPLIGNETGLDLYHNMDNISGSTVINDATVTGAINNSSAMYGSPNFMPSLNNYPSGFNLGNDTLLCSSGAISLSIPNNGYTSYEWNTGSSNQNILADTVGTYFAKAYVSGCYVSDTIIITKDTNKFSVINDTICNGDSLWFGGVFYYNNGSYSDTLLASNGCDSISSLILAINLPDTTYIVDDICNGDSVLFGGTFYYNNGSYSDTLLASNGCDSISILILAINSPDTTYIVDNICNGDSVLFGGNYIYNSGNYTDKLTNALGCDSLIFLSVIGDTIPPVYNCLNNDTDTLYDNCVYTVKDYTLGLTFSDNCSSDSNIIITQIPSAGTVLNLDPNIVTPFNVTIAVTDESNNTKTCNFTLNVYCEKLLEIPQFISPNGDGKNDTWIIKNLQAYPNNNVKIFNRWGALVFEEIDYNNDWDGTLNKGEGKYLPGGTYYYLLDINSKVYSGYIHIQK